MTIRILAVAGSLRAASHNRALLRSLADHAPPHMQVTQFDRLADVPPFSEDLEVDTPDGVAAFWHAVKAADVLLFATPEYNQSMPGVLKNAIDWLTRDPAGSPLRGKPVAVTGTTVGTWGTRLAQQQLRTLLTACGAYVLPTAVLFNAKADSGAPASDVLGAFMQAVGADAVRFVRES